MEYNITLANNRIIDKEPVIKKLYLRIHLVLTVPIRKRLSACSLQVTEYFKIKQWLVCTWLHFPVTLWHKMEIEGRK